MTLKQTYNSYLQLSQANSWFLDRPRFNQGWVALSQAQQEEGLILATDYIEQTYKGSFRGALIAQSQLLEFPRTGLFDTEGRDLGACPLALIAATCILAYKAAVDQEELCPDIAPGGQPLSESVGPLSSNFAKGANPSKRYLKVERLLTPLLQEISFLKKVTRG